MRGYPIQELEGFDTRLLPGEHEDVTEDIIPVLGREWLLANNVMLGDRTPSELIGTKDEFHLRIMLRQFMVADLS